MSEFILKGINTESRIELVYELGQVGFDKSYLRQATEKYMYKNIKIFQLSIPQANILKQTAISVGADCAVHRETITCSIDETDCILGGSISQLRKIAQKLKAQPFKLSKLGEELEEKLDIKLSPMKLKGKIFDYKKPYIVGILNLTKNSFSDGGDFFEYDAAQKHLLELIEEGADIIDIGAESTKPYSMPVPAEAQLEKILPILEFIKGIQIPISIDTRNAEVAKECILAGADIINDVSGLEYDEDMAKIVAELDVPIIIQHTQGTPENMQDSPTYDNLMDEIYINLKEKTDLAIKAGIRPENIIIDPGIGFGKTKDQNFEIIEKIEELYPLGFPVMMGLSRKSLLNMKDESNEVKDIFTLAINSSLLDKKVNFIRVHNVKLHKKLIKLKFETSL